MDVKLHILNDWRKEEEKNVGDVRAKGGFINDVGIEGSAGIGGCLCCSRRRLHLLM